MSLTLSLTAIIIISFLALANLFGFFVMFDDKARAVDKRERTSEGTLFFIAVIGGGIGVYAGMFVFRHKTRKWYFYFGIPLVIIQNLGFLYLLANKFGALSLSFNGLSL